MEKHENPHGVLNRIHVLGKHHPAFALGADAEAEISKLLTDMLGVPQEVGQDEIRVAGGMYVWLGRRVSDND